MKTIIVGLFFLASAAQAGAGQPVLRVNGVPISRAELVIAERLAQLPEGEQQADSSAGVRRAVEQAVSRALLVGVATKAGITVSREEVKASVAKQESQVQDKEGFKASIAEAGVSQEDLQTVEEWRLLISRYVETKVMPTISVSAEQVDAFYKEHPEQFEHGDQVRIRMILVEPSAPGEEADAAARRKAESALARVKAGEDFAKVAAEVSDDPTHSVGGEIGWVRKGMLLQSLEPAVFALQDGGVTEVLKSHYGYHIFKVEGHRGPGTYSLEEIRSSLAVQLQRRAVGEAVGRIVAEQKAKATIEVLDPALKAVLEASTAPSPSKDGSAPR
jgi:peptidyl-prolyl cis-trans isomerase SurA